MKNPSQTEGLRFPITKQMSEGDVAHVLKMDKLEAVEDFTPSPELSY